MRVPPDVTLMVVDAGPDVADDWIAGRVQPGDIVVTSDIALASRARSAKAAAGRSHFQRGTAPGFSQRWMRRR